MRIHKHIAVLLAVWAGLVSSSANALIVAGCDEGFHSSNFWKHFVVLWVQNHPIIVGVSDIRVTIPSFGTGYRGGQEINSVSGSNSDEDDIRFRDQQGVTVMDAKADAEYSATKYFNGLGMTWNPFTSNCRYYAKSIGVWQEDTTLRDTYSDTYTTE